MKENNKNKKINILFIITNIVFLMLIIGTTYGIFRAKINNQSSSPVKVITKVVNSLLLSVEDEEGNISGFSGFVPLNIQVDDTNFSSTNGNLTEVLYAKAKLKTNNKPNHTFSKNYNVAIVISDNSYIYSISPDKPEILLKITAPGENAPMQTLPDGTSVTTVTDGKGNQVTGFDITTRDGIINIANNYPISGTTGSNGESVTVNQEWKIEVIYVNYQENQNANGGHVFDSNVVIGLDNISVTPTLTSINVKVPTKLSTGEEITSYEYEIKKATEETYTKKLTAQNNEYEYTELDSGTDYDIKVTGIAEPKREIVLKAKVRTLPSLADHIMGLPLQNEKGGAGLYHHNGTIKSGNTILDANDDSYRYAGASNDVHNYVCIGNDSECSGSDKENYMYRIIGVFRNSETEQYQVKLIKSTSIGIKSWNTERKIDDDGNYNKWEYVKNGQSNSAALNIYLNTKLYDSLGEIKNKISAHKWQIGGIYWSDFINKTVPEVYKAEISSNKLAQDNVLSSPTKIGLMYISDYLYAAPKEKWTLCGRNSSSSAQDYRSAYTEDWINSSDYQWTISRISDTLNYVFFVDNIGYIYNFAADNPRAVRPVFYLESNVMISGGDGTQNNPYRLG